MSTSVLKALLGKLDIKRLSLRVFSISWQASPCQQSFSKPCLVNLISKDTHLEYFLYLGSLAMPTSVLKALPGKLDIKRHSPRVFSISRQASRYQQAFSKPCLLNLKSKDFHLEYSLYLGKPRDVNNRSQSLAW